MRELREEISSNEALKNPHCSTTQEEFGDFSRTERKENILWMFLARGQPAGEVEILANYLTLVPSEGSLEFLVTFVSRQK